MPLNLIEKLSGNLFEVHSNLLPKIAKKRFSLLSMGKLF